MNRFEYLDALRDALYGLPEAQVAAIVADYERRFGERSAVGQSEEEIMASLGHPQAIAAEKRATARLNAVQDDKGPKNKGRAYKGVADLIGLMVFNLFLIVPAIIYLVLLLVAYVGSIAMYGVGILLAAASLAGVTGIAMDDPIHHGEVYTVGRAKIDNQTSVDIDQGGIRVQSQLPGLAAASASTDASAKTSSSASANASASANVAGKPAVDAGVTAGNAIAAAQGTESKAAANQKDDTESGVIEWNDDPYGNAHVNIDVSGIHIHAADDEGLPKVVTLGNHFLGESREAQVGLGVGLVLAGIFLFLLCLVVSKFTWIGLCRLAQMEFAVFKNA